MVCSCSLGNPAPLSAGLFMYEGKGSTKKTNRQAIRRLFSNVLRINLSVYICLSSKNSGLNDNY